MEREPLEHAATSVGEQGATDRRRLSRENETAAEIAPPPALDAGEIDRAGELTVQQRIFDGEANVHCDITLPFGRRCTEVGREEDVVERSQWTIRGERLLAVDIEKSAREMPATERGEERR